ncbi:MAG: DUF4198 domain-containing protein [Candidatus Hydrothermales bacterium]
MRGVSLILVTLGLLYSHDFWIEISNPYPKENEKIELFIKGGHKLFESEIAPRENLIKEFKVIKPSGEEVKLEYKREKNYIVSEFTPSEKGTYLVFFTLSKGEEVLYIGKSYFYLEKITEFKNLGYDFEIKLENFDFKEGEIKFSPSNYEFLNEKGKGRFKNLYKSKKGLNLIIKREKDRVCTLTFYSR